METLASSFTLLYTVNIIFKVLQRKIAFPKFIVKCRNKINKVSRLAKSKNDLVPNDRSPFSKVLWVSLH